VRFIQRMGSLVGGTLRGPAGNTHKSSRGEQYTSAVYKGVRLVVRSKPPN
jgi:hypothetical protein